MAGAQTIVPRVGVGDVGEIARQAGRVQRLDDQRLVGPAILQVQPPAECLVEAAGRLGPVVVLCGDEHPSGAPRPVDEVPVEVREVVATVVQDREAHHLERESERAESLDLGQPAGGDPRKRADRIDEHVHLRNGIGRHRHVHHRVP